MAAPTTRASGGLPAYGQELLRHFLSSCLNLEKLRCFCCFPFFPSSMLRLALSVAALLDANRTSRMSVFYNVRPGRPCLCHCELAQGDHFVPTYKYACCRASPQQSRGFFSGSKGTFTSFFSRTGHSAGGASPGGDASIHGGAAGHFRQVRPYHSRLPFCAA